MDIFQIINRSLMLSWKTPALLDLLLHRARAEGNEDAVKQWLRDLDLGELPL